MSQIYIGREQLKYRGRLKTITLEKYEISSECQLPFGRDKTNPALDLLAFIYSLYTC